MADFTATEVEDGTGRSTAIVYETVAATSAWLAARGYAAFAADSEADQKEAALRATEELEDEMLALGFRGGKTARDQGLLLPARGAYRQDESLLDPDEIPAERLEAHRLACEHIAAGTWMPVREAAGVEEIAKDGARVKFKTTANGGSLSANHPEIYARLRRVCPP